VRQNIFLHRTAKRLRKSLRTDCVMVEGMCAASEDCFFRRKALHPSLQTRFGAHLPIAETSPSSRMGPKSSLGRHLSSFLTFGDGYTFCRHVHNAF
jgi:hypothetical protein